jgi:tetratricopeptide (TPR) repeat protein
MRLAALPLAFVFLGLSVVTPALAAPDSKSQTSAIDKARSQFHRGLALETAGDWSGALGLFQEVAAVKLTPQVRFHIGLCEEHLGQLAAALGDYELAAHEAEEARVAEVSAQVASRRADLRARIPQITIVRGAGGEYATVSLDGVSLGSSSIGAKLPIDPGPHRVEAVASGFKPFRVTIEIAEKEAKKVEITLERLPVAAPAAETSPLAAHPGAESTEPEKPSPLPFVIGGVGVASLGASAVFFVLRQKAINTLEQDCTLRGNECPKESASTYDHGKAYNLLANVTLGVGVAGVGVGTYLLLTQKKQPTSSVAFHLAPVGPSASLGATAVGSF